MTKKTDLTMRLSVKGRDELLKTMRDMGGEYAKAAKRIESGSKEANVAIKSVNTAAKEGNAALEGYAQRGGVLGRVLKDLGPIGLAAGASIGVITVALGAALKVSREAVSAFDALGKSADTLQLTTDMLQGLKAAAKDEGVEFAQVETAARSLTKAHADLMRGTGQLYGTLKDTNPQLLEMLRNTTSNDERFRILTTALQGAESQTERNTIAYAAFGESGLAVARMLERQQGGVDGMIAKYREMGLIVREDVIRNAEDMETQFGVASQVIDLQLKQAFIDLAPFLVQAAQLAADVAKGIGDIVARSKELSDRTAPQLEGRMEELIAQMEKAGASREQIRRAIEFGEDLDLPEKRRPSATAGPTSAAINEQVQAEDARIAEALSRAREIYGEMGRRSVQEYERAASEERRRAAAKELATRKTELENQIAEETRIAREAMEKGDLGASADAGFKAARAKAELLRVEEEIARRAALPTARDPAADAAAAAAAKAREAELNRLRTEAIALQKQLGDYTAYLANETARYQKLLDEGLITQAQYDAAVKSLKDELAGVTAATDLWKGMIEAARTPMEVITDKMEKLDDDLAKGKINIDLYRKAMELLTGEMAKASDAADQAAPGYKDAEAIRAELERVANEALSPAAKLAKEQERIKALVDGGQLDPSAATDWLVLYKKRLDEATKSMGLLAAGERLLDGIQQGRIRTWGDMKQAIGDLLIETVKQYLAAQQAMGSAGAGGGGGLLGQIINFGKSFFQGGGNTPASHSGGLGYNPPQIRRTGSGRLANERLQYIREDEEVLTPYGKMNIASQMSQLAAERAAMSGLVTRALAGTAGGGGGDVKVSVHNYAGAEVEVSKREGPDGPEVSVDIRGKMKDMARSGVFDGPFKERYGLTPNT